LDQNKTYRRSSIKAGDLVGADDKMAAGRRNNRRRFVENTGLVGRSVVNLSNGDDDIGWRLRLRMKSLDCRGSNRDTCKQG